MVSTKKLLCLSLITQDFLNEAGKVHSSSPNQPQGSSWNSCLPEESTGQVRLRKNSSSLTGSHTVVACGP